MLFQEYAPTRRSLEMESRRNGFTVVELLIVVGVAGILAVVALPKWTEKQIKANIAEVRSDEAVIGMALEAYRTDNDAWVPQWLPLYPVYIEFWRMTTPVAYLGSFEDLVDPFWRPSDRPEYLWLYRAWCWENYNPDGGQSPSDMTYRFMTGRYGAWRVASPGPILEFNWYLYDPTNGLISKGDLFRSQKSPIGLYDPSIVY